MELIDFILLRGGRAALLAGAATILLAAPESSFAQKTDPLEEEAAQAQRRMRALRDLDRMINDAESARLRGQCKTVAQIHSYFHGTFEGLPAGVMEYIERLRERIDAIAAAECPPGSGTPSVQPPAAQPDPPPTNGQAGAVPVPPPPVGTTGTQPPAGTGQAAPPTGSAPAGSEPAENIMDEIDQLDRLEWEQRKAAREARLKAEAEASGASTTTTTPPKPAAPGSQAQGLTAADDRAVAENLEEAGRIEDSVRDIEGDEWLHQDVRAGVLKRVRENLLQDKRFPPESIQRWVERLDRVWESLPPEARAEAEKPLGPVRSTTIPLKLPPTPPPSTGPQSSVPLNPQEQTFLALHNQARAEVGVPPLQWDPTLAASAKAYAIQLTSAGQLVHSSREGRKNVRENLLQNLPGDRSPAEMIGVWTAEKSKFKPGIFPDVSTTGNWYDIGHYTQMVWETTTHVGCAINGDSRYEWLVCHYSPPGNRDGTAIGLPPAPQPRHMAGSSPPMPQLRGVAGQDGAAPPAPKTPTRNTDNLAMIIEADSGGKVIGGEWVGPTSTRPHPRGVVGQDGIAPANSTTTTAPPPPPPPPTARDDAPGGNEDNHPLVGYGAEAFIRHSAALDCGDAAATQAELAKIRYAIDELRKRLTAARKAGPFSAVKPEDVQRQINLLESFLRAAEQRRPRGACPPMPQPRGVAGQTR